MGQLTKDQSAANIETAYANAALNRVNQIGPYGSTTWVPPGASRSSPQGSAPPFGPYFTPSSGNSRAAPLGGQPRAPQQFDRRSMSPFGVPWSVGGEGEGPDTGPSFEPYQSGREFDGANITGFDIGKAATWSPTVATFRALSGQGGPQNPFETGPMPAPSGMLGPDRIAANYDAQYQDAARDAAIERAGNDRAPSVGAPGYYGGSGYGGSGYGGSGYGQAGGGYGGYDINQPWTQITTLDPAEQANLDQQRSLTNRALGISQNQLTNIGNTLSTPLDYSGAPKVEGLNFGNLPSVRGADYGSLGAIPQLNLSGAPGMPDAAQFQGPNSQTTDAIYKAYTSRLAPQWDRERESVESRLATQGVNVQTNPEAYSRALEDYNKSRTDAYQMALAQAVGSGVQENSNAFNRSLAARQQGVGEAGQLFGANMQGRQQLGSEMAQQQASDLQRRQQMAAEQGQLYNASLGARQQAIQEQTALRNQPINELAALLGTSGGVNTPQFGAIPQVNVAAPDVMGANAMAYQGQLNNYNQQQQSRNAGLGAAGTLAGIGLQTAFPAAKVAGR